MKIAKKKEKALITVERPGPAPPCLERAPGQCRGCFGWEQMLEAAKAGRQSWHQAPIHCDCTGLTVRVSFKNQGPSHKGR